MTHNPALHYWRLVSLEVVENDVNVKILADRAVDLAQEVDEVLCTVLFLCLCEDLTCGHIQ